MLHLMRELLLINLAKTLPKYAHKKVYLNMSKKVNLIILHLSMPLYIYFVEMHFFLLQYSYIFKWLQSLISFDIYFVVNQNYNKFLHVIGYHQLD